jgi:hypothetical protein
MSVHDDLAAAGHALDALQAAVTALSAHFHQGNLAESVDLRRLREDVSRIAADLDLLRAAPSAVPAPGPVGTSDYDPAFWADGDTDDMDSYSPPPG